MKKFWLAVLIIVVVIGIAWLAVSNKNKSKTASAAQRTAIVSISASGFSPATVTVKPGTKVTWVNTDSAKNASHRVKADPYPSGDSLPGLDSQVDMADGATYSYLFSTSGTFKYHDQVNPLLNGEVVVTQ
jgi:plastocyanin